MAKYFDKDNKEITAEEFRASIARGEEVSSDLPEQCVRIATFDIAERGTDESIPVVISTETPVFMRDIGGDEILLHKSPAIDLSRAPLPIIVTHKDNQINVGIVDGISISNGMMRGNAKFGERSEAREYKTDVTNGIIRSVSVGYIRRNSKFRNDGVLITDRWSPTHVAMVAEPADSKAGFYRALYRDESRERTNKTDDTSTAEIATTKESQMAESNGSATGTAEEVSNTSGADQERLRQASLRSLGREYNLDNEAVEKWCTSGTSIGEAVRVALEMIAQRSKATQSVAHLDLSQKEKREYSIHRAINAIVQKTWSKAGLEAECHQEIQKRVGRTVSENNFFVPVDVQMRTLDVAKRDLTVGTTTAGGFLVETSNQSFIEMLRNRSVAMTMGSTNLSGLQGNVTVPKQTAAATAVWLANEASTITESQQTFAQLTLTPKTVGAYTEISRLLTLQSSPSAEAITMTDLSRVTALAVDLAVLSGSGASGQPTGIINTAGIGAVTGTTLGYAGILEFQTDVAAANVMPTRGGYVTTPSVAALLMQRARFSNTDTPLWTGNIWNGQVSGFPAMSSLQMAAASMLFGDWSSVIVAEWGVLELEVNPYANFQAGIIGVRAIYTVDVGIRYPAAFSLATTIT
jgi:HK97 family phage major capsid protein